jgi:hypothetical protein
MQTVKPDLARMEVGSGDVAVGSDKKVAAGERGQSPVDN